MHLRWSQPTTLEQLRDLSGGQFLSSHDASRQRDPKSRHRRRQRPRAQLIKSHRQTECAGG